MPKLKSGAESPTAVVPKPTKKTTSKFTTRPATTPQASDSATATAPYPARPSATDLPKRTTTQRNTPQQPESSADAVETTAILKPAATAPDTAQSLATGSLPETADLLPESIAPLPGPLPLATAPDTAQLPETVSLPERTTTQRFKPSVKLATLPHSPTNTAERLIRKKHQEEEKERQDKDFVAGTIFRIGEPDTQPLYRMLERLGIEHESRLPNTPLIRSARYDVFKDYVAEIYRLFRANLRGKITVYDDVIHRVAFLFAMEIPLYCNKFDLVNMFNHAKQDVNSSGKEKKEPIWTPILQIIRDDFIKYEFGWRFRPVTSYISWKAEVNFAQDHGFNPRPELFPSYTATTNAQNQKQKIENETRKRMDEIALEKSKYYNNEFTIMSDEESLKACNNNVMIHLFQTTGVIMRKIPGKPFLDFYEKKFGKLPDKYYEIINSQLVNSE
ncbi:MAG: hypothetical protein LBK82_00265 [Planctomycetaceae bacterium]|nr:hypothetical protein [Planctomycetaceae bacterium]